MRDEVIIGILCRCCFCHTLYWVLKSYRAISNFKQMSMFDIPYSLIIFLRIKNFELNDYFNEHHGYKKDVIVDLVEWSRVNRFNPKNKWKDNIKSDIDSRWVQKDWRLTRWHCYIFLPTTIYELHLPQIPCVHNTKHNSIIIQ